MSTHRGCKEIDIILGKFVEQNLDKLTDEEIELYEKLLSENDVDLYSAIVNIIYNEPIPENLNYGEELLIKLADKR